MVAQGGDSPSGSSSSTRSGGKYLTLSLSLLAGDVAEGCEALYKTHMCPECKRCFKKRTHLVEHLHLHFPDPSLQCPNCRKFFTSKSKLKIHLLREAGQKAHRCPLCRYSSVERNALNRHMASMHEDSSNFYSDVYSCPVCEEKFRLSQALKEHLKSHKAEPKRLSCFQGGCDYCAEDRREFIRHLKDAHGVKAVECRHHACSLLFGTAEAMEAHRKTHYAFHCQQCDFICSNKHLFRKHKKQGHPGSEQLRCGFCPYATFNPVEFHDHVGKMHANEKVHKCTQCAFATAHKRVLIRHMLLHTGGWLRRLEVGEGLGQGFWVFRFPSPSLSLPQPPELIFPALLPRPAAAPSLLVSPPQERSPTSASCATSPAATSATCPSTC